MADEVPVAGTGEQPHVPIEDQPLPRRYPPQVSPPRPNGGARPVGGSFITNDITGHFTCPAGFRVLERIDRLSQAGRIVFHVVQQKSGGHSTRVCRTIDEVRAFLSTLQP